LKYIIDVQLTAKVKLLADIQQTNLLRLTMERANACCDWISNVAWGVKRFGQFGLHKIVYKDARAAFPELSSQVVIRCEAKVSQAYALDKKVKRSFKPLGAIEYDARLLTWNVNKHEVSIWACGGRLRLSFQCGERQLDLLQGKIGQADLVLIDGVFYLFASCWVEEGKTIDVHGVLGVDLGIVNIAVDSDGQVFSGKDVEDNRRKFFHRRRNLQRNGSKSAKRKLKSISGKQARFQKHTNHQISKCIVRKAQDTNRAIALEDLSGIRDRVTVRRKQRARHANWSFYDLRAKIEYKAKRAGVPVIPVDPRNTSKMCSVDGHIDSANRPTQSIFKCTRCGFEDLADHNAALNIRARGEVNLPMVSTLTG
jgi:IS605 OrfB family transposase